MAETIKCLAQAAPAATTPTDLYTVPASTACVTSTLFVCNQTNGSVKVRVWAAIGGASTTTAQYLLYDVKVLKESFLTLTTGISLAATDVIRVQTDTADVSFNLFGVEVTA